MNSKFLIVSILSVVLGVAQMQGDDMPPMGGQGGPGNMNRGGGRKGPGGQHGMLPFLQGLDQEAVQSFFEIVKDEDLTKAEIQTKEDAWAATQNQTVQDIYNEFKTNRTAHIEEMKTNITSSIASLSESAQKIVTDIQAILEDQTITRKEEQEKIKAIIEAASKEDLESIKSVVPLPGMGGRGGMEGPGGMGGPGGMEGPGGMGGPGGMRGPGGRGGPGNGGEFSTTVSA
uniref:DUF148 domain-containing protein n=1 Tax=Parastrongyloides trichosuri TaxID=131310 RepID=A0A0N5A4Q3_PARTI